MTRCRICSWEWQLRFPCKPSVTVQTCQPRHQACHRSYKRPRLSLKHLNAHHKLHRSCTEPESWTSDDSQCWRPNNNLITGPTDVAKSNSNSATVDEGVRIRDRGSDQLLTPLHPGTVQSQVLCMSCVLATLHVGIALLACSAHMLLKLFC